MMCTYLSRLEELYLRQVSLHGNVHYAVLSENHREKREIKDLQSLLYDKNFSRVTKELMQSLFLNKKLINIVPDRRIARVPLIL